MEQSKKMEYAKKEIVTRYVTAIYTSGAYSPDVPERELCLVCGFAFEPADPGKAISFSGFFFRAFLRCFSRKSFSLLAFAFFMLCVGR